MDVFGRQDQILLGGLSSDSMFFSWPALAAVGGGLGMLVQRVGMEYRQPIRRIFEIGPGVIPVGNGELVNGEVCDDAAAAIGLFGEFAADACAFRTQPTYYIVGRPEGRLQFQRFVGPQVLGQCFYRKYGSPCGPNVITLSGKAGCHASDQSARRMTWIMNGVTIDGLNADINGQEMVIQEGVAAMFAGLNVLIDGVDLNCGAELVAA